MKHLEPTPVQEASLPGMILEIEQDPTDINNWLTLWRLVSSQNDLVSAASLKVIVDGLKSIHRSFKNDPTMFFPFRSVLCRLARGYNNPRLFMELGQIYLREFGNPRISREHFKRSCLLGCQDKDLEVLMKTVDELMVYEDKRPQNRVQTNRYYRPRLSSIISKSGRLSLIEKVDEKRRASNLSKGSATTNGMAPKNPLIEVKNAIEEGLFKRDGKLVRNDKKLLWEAWSDLGYLFYESNDFIESEKAYRKAHDLNPNLLLSQYNLGLALQRNLKFDDALAAYMRADRLERNNPKVWCKIGCVFFLQENYAQAESAWRFTVSVQPDYAQAWNNLAAALGSQNKLDGAAEACREALKYQTFFPEACFNLGLIYFAHHEFEKALAYLRIASKLPLLEAATMAYISMTLAHMGDTLGSEEALSNALKLKVAPELASSCWLSVGRAWIERRNFRKAKAATEKACKYDPKNIQNWLELGLINQYTHDISAAQKCFERAYQDPITMAV